MISFESDYNIGAHTTILNRLVETNFEQLSGYGNDKYCESAKKKIAELCGVEPEDIFFLVGGTQTNQLVIDSLVKCEGVIAVDSGHINVHEAGAIEYSGHKVLTLPSHDGKMHASDLKKYLSDFYDDEMRAHTAVPGMVYITQPTELGTLYTKKELTEIYKICKCNDLPLFIDGARLGYGLASDECDFTLKDIASLCDVFYIGGTKVGALCGEAVVYTKNNKPKNFITYVKQHGALLSKGRLLGIQFDTLFTDNMYFNISKHAIKTANMLKEVLERKGIKFLLKSPTNQQFVIFENSKLEEIKKHVKVTVWEKVSDTETAVRLVTSWATKEEEIEEFEKLL